MSFNVGNSVSWLLAGSQDLTNSPLDRQNILNNPYALAEIEKAAGIRGIPFESKTVVLKEQVAAFFEVTLRTVENYLQQNAEELSRNGYEILKGKRLKDLKLAIQGLDVPETDFGNILKTPQLGVLDFRAFLNLAMLMTESERARLLRQAILDIVIDTINQRTGGGTKYINQRDEDFLNSAFNVEIEKAVGIRGIPFKGKTVVLKEQAAAFFEVPTRTIDSNLERTLKTFTRPGI